MEVQPIPFEAPRFVDGRELRIAGLDQQYPPTPAANGGADENSAGIPAQWQRFAPYIGNILGQVGGVTYGVRRNSRDPNVASYLCGVEVSDFTRVPADLARLQIAPQHYAVFSHRGDVLSIVKTWRAIFSQWRPQAGLELLPDAPDFERYSEDFDPRTGAGVVEIWVPVKR